VTYSLSMSETDVALDHMLHGGGARFNVGGYIEVSAADVERWRLAHAALVRTEPAFGLRIDGASGELRKILLPASERTSSLPLLDFSADMDGLELDAWQGEWFESPFNLEGGDLFRACLMRLPEGRLRYYGVAHHVAMDGFGFANWVRRLSAIHSDPCSEALLSTNATETLTSHRASGSDAYWQAYFARGEVARMARPPDATSTGRTSGRTVLKLAREGLDLLGTVFGKERLTSALVVLSAVGAAVATGARSLVVALPVHNRRGRAERSSLGCFVKELPVILDLQACGDMSLRDTISMISRDIAGHMKHRHVSAGDLARWLGAGGHPGDAFDVRVNHLLLPEALPFGDSHGSLAYLSHHRERIPLSVTIVDNGPREDAWLQVDYHLASFSERDAGALAERLRWMIHVFAKSADASVRSMDLLSPTDRAAMAWHAEEDAAFAPPRALHAGFEEMARATPERIAILSGNERVSYGDLNRLADRYASVLQKSGVGREAVVGICVGRDSSMVAAVLGVLKSGAAFVPIDPHWPDARVDEVLRSCAADIVITTSPHRAPFIHVRTVEPAALDGLPVADVPLPRVSPEDLAYVIFTSGSTGRPKGVEITHGSAHALVSWARKEFSDEDMACVLASTALTFDLAIFEIFATLSRGGSIAIVENALALLDDAINITMINTVPSALSALLEAGRLPPGTRIVNVAGEPLSERIVNDALACVGVHAVYNLYGPTEDTTYTTFKRFDTPLSSPPSIGKALSGTSVYVLDLFGRELPVGAVGELHISGPKLARGYRGQPAMTLERFVELPLGGRGRRCYRTGDMVKRRWDGDLEYLGRIDEQVKLRGFRIELEEISRCLDGMDGVNACAVVMSSAGHAARIAAFVEADRNGPLFRQEGMTDSDLKSALRRVLPEYMIPSSIEFVDALPRTPHGKVDKAALRIRAAAPPSTRPGPALPVGLTELRLLALARARAGTVPELAGLDDDLHALGIDSLQLMMLGADIHKAFGVRLGVSTLLTMRTLSELASVIDSLASAGQTAATDTVAEGYL